MIRRPAKNQTPIVAASPSKKDRVKRAGVQWKSVYFSFVTAVIIFTSYADLKHFVR
jgi:hypothetical protein